jgi:hypothetical protein
MAKWDNPDNNLDETLKKARSSKREWIDVLGSAFRLYMLKRFDQGADLGQNTDEYLRNSMKEFCDKEFSKPMDYPASET